MKDNIIIPKKILLISISCVLAIISGFIGLRLFLNSEFYYNKTSKIGTKTYSNGKTVQYNKKGQVEYTYKKDSTGKITKYSKTGKKLETYK